MAEEELPESLEGGEADESPRTGPRSDGKLPPQIDYRRIQGEREAKTAPGFFTIYKRGQGYWTRMGTLSGVAIIGALTAQFFFLNMPSWGVRDVMTRGLLILAFLAVYGLLAFRIMNKPRSVDFLIATDSEMRKVNWTTRKEVIGSTKVVIFFMLLIAVTLFLIDVVFGWIFHKAGVLQFGPMG